MTIDNRLWIVPLSPFACILMVRAFVWACGLEQDPSKIAVVSAFLSIAPMAIVIAGSGMGERHPFGSIKIGGKK